MLRNIKIVVRRLMSRKFYTAINILGLSISLSTAMLIIIWAQDERSFDRFHHDYHRIHKVNAHVDPANSGTVWSNTPGPIVNYALTSPDVEFATRFAQDRNETLTNDERNHQIRGLKIGYADAHFFDIFNFPLLEGSLTGFQSNFTNAFITESTAEKLFGSSDIVGKTFSYDDDIYSIAGVLADIPHNSTLQFDVLMPFGNLAQYFRGNGKWKTVDEDLGSYRFATYIKAKPNTTSDAISKFVTDAFSKAWDGENSTFFVLQPLKNMHLVTPDGNDSSLRIVQVFEIIAALLLVIGAVNYVNLSTARAMDRAKEISVRKIVGATRRQLFVQSILDTLIIFGISVVIAIISIFALQAAYTQIAQKPISHSLHGASLWLHMGLTVGATLLLSSIYPAIQLSGFKPIESLNVQHTKQLSPNTTRKLLVVFQFFVSITLIVCTLVIKNQMDFIQEFNLGYDKEHVLTLSLPAEAYKHIDAIRGELNNNRAIEAVSLTGIWNIGDYSQSTGDIAWPGKPKDQTLIVTQATIDKDFIPLMDIQLLEGSNFTGMPADSAGYIINETLAKQMGLTPPFVGASLSLHEVPGRVIGVVKDFHFKSIKEQIGPMVFWTHWNANTLYVKTTSTQAQQAIKALETIYNRYPSDSPFSYTFIDEQFDALYKSEQRTALLFDVFSGIAVFISSLGLFALATHEAQKRVKEIGIRKVLGAGVFEVVWLLCKNYLALVFLAILIACPVAVYLMNEWLRNFAYKTDLQVSSFIMGSATAVGLAIFTVSWQAIRAARANPVKSLRHD